jgi:hypothetical protein
VSVAKIHNRLTKVVVDSYVMLGGGLFILPGRNFARFNLMMYILFCLVIRTAYQGVQFNMMVEVSSLMVFKVKVDRLLIC